MNHNQGWDRLAQLKAVGVSARSLPQLVLSGSWADRAGLRRPAPRPTRRALFALAAVTVAGCAIGYEMHTSALQSRILSWYAPRATFEVAPGPSSNIVFPRSGPFDDRLGYSQLPRFQERLRDAGYGITEQAVFSPELLRMTGWGLTPPYRLPAARGLVIRGSDGTPLYDARPTRRVFHRYDEVPDLVVKALLFTENRELGDPRDPRANPVVEWDRMARAGLSYVANRAGLPVHVEGGSTLATQLEKYQHSEDGNTQSPADKVRQMASASLAVYREGADTRDARRQIILDYLNTVPLAAGAGYGEVHGLQEGLEVWFGRDPEEVMRDLQPDAPTMERALAFKQVFSLLCAARAPSDYLLRRRSALEQRVNYQVSRLAESGEIPIRFAAVVRATPPGFERGAPRAAARSWVEAKSSNAIRTRLLTTLDVPSLYALDRLDLDVRTTLDARLQSEVEGLFAHLGDPGFVREHGLVGERLLSEGDPSQVLYSFLMYERTPDGNELRVIADNLDQPLDLNYGMKLELGSTAKLRTLAHYLEVMESLYTPADREGRDDPLTRWAGAMLAEHPGMTLQAFLEAAMERRYSGSPREAFFTGGGLHTFRNFDSDEDDESGSVREGLTHSLNLVYIRIMRDLVRYHEARLPYDADAVLSDPKHPERARLVAEAADAEARGVLEKSWVRYRGMPTRDVVPALLGERGARNARDLAVLHLAWHPRSGDEAADARALEAWLASRLGTVDPGSAARLLRNYGNPDFTLLDYAWLLQRQPLDIWCAGEVMRDSAVTWAGLLDRSEEARRVSSRWLLDTRHRRAQDLRLRIRIEQDAFARMTPYWRRLGFPFSRLVPSYATAIGSSGDRPGALAELMGIIVNDGVKRPVVSTRELRFAAGTPYHTTVGMRAAAGERVMSEAMATTLRAALTDVVEEGTARRVAGVFRREDGTPVEVGGKTGSGDNRFKTFAKGGDLVSSRALNRTATFVFEIDQRYFGVVTAIVPGSGAEAYRFTSALPVSLLKLLAPAIQHREPAAEPVRAPGVAQVADEPHDAPPAIAAGAGGSATSTTGAPSAALAP